MRSIDCDCLGCNSCSTPARKVRCDAIDGATRTPSGQPWAPRHGEAAGGYRSSGALQVNCCPKGIGSLMPSEGGHPRLQLHVTSAKSQPKWLAATLAPQKGSRVAIRGTWEPSRGSICCGHLRSSQSRKKLGDLSIAELYVLNFRDLIRQLLSVSAPCGDGRLPQRHHSATGHRRPMCRAPESDLLWS